MSVSSTDPLNAITVGAATSSAAHPHRDGVRAERAGVDDAVAARGRESYGEWEQLLLDRVVSAQHDGEIPQDRDPRQLAASLPATARGMDAMGKAGLGAPFMHHVVDSAILLLGVPAAASSPVSG